MPTPRRLSSIDESRAAELPAGEAVSAQPEAAAKPAGGEDAAAAVELEWFKDPRVRAGLLQPACTSAVLSGMRKWRAFTVSCGPFNR